MDIVCDKTGVTNLFTLQVTNNAVGNNLCDHGNETNFPESVGKHATEDPSEVAGQCMTVQQMLAILEAQNYIYIFTCLLASRTAISAANSMLPSCCAWD